MYYPVHVYHQCIDDPSADQAAEVFSSVCGHESRNHGNPEQVQEQERSGIPAEDVYGDTGSISEIRSESGEWMSSTSHHYAILICTVPCIYNIPAYVPQVYHIYEGLADQLKAAGITIQTIVTDAGVKTNTYTVTTAINAAGKLAADKTAINYYVDILGQISSGGWKNLIANDKYAQFIDVMKTTAREANHINSFLGLNIADTPSIKSVSIIIPILSAATQIISTKISMAGMPQQNADPNSTSAQTMKTMNTTMPLVTGLMCFMFPIGVGVYWITGNIFRIIQSFVINRVFKNMDVDEMVKENLKKAKEKYERAGMDSSALDTVARMKTSNIQAPKEEPKEKKKKSISSVAGKASTTEVKKTNTKYKKGSIADIANMLNNRDED